MAGLRGPQFPTRSHDSEGNDLATLAPSLWEWMVDARVFRKLTADASGDSDRGVVNRRFAHFSTREAPDDVTLGELSHALDMVGERYRVFARLLAHRATNLETPLPSDWSRPFLMQLQPSPQPPSPRNS
jgi:hypothetical protein